MEQNEIDDLEKQIRGLPQSNLTSSEQELSKEFPPGSWAEATENINLNLKIEELREAQENFHRGLNSTNGASLGNVFSERELGLIANCESYAKNRPAGLPAHNLMVIISKYSELLSYFALNIKNSKE